MNVIYIKIILFLIMNDIITHKKLKTQIIEGETATRINSFQKHF